MFSEGHVAYRLGTCACIAVPILPSAVRGNILLGKGFLAHARKLCAAGMRMYVWGIVWLYCLPAPDQPPLAIGRSRSHSPSVPSLPHLAWSHKPGTSIKSSIGAVDASATLACTSGKSASLAVIHSSAPDSPALVGLAWPCQLGACFWKVSVVRLARNAGTDLNLAPHP